MGKINNEFHFTENDGLTNVMNDVEFFTYNEIHTKFVIFLRYYNGLVRFLAECKEQRGPLQKPPTRNKDEWPKIEEV